MAQQHKIRYVHDPLSPRSGPAGPAQVTLLVKQIEQEVRKMETRHGTLAYEALEQCAKNCGVMPLDPAEVPMPDDAAVDDIEQPFLDRLETAIREASLTVRPNELVYMLVTFAEHILLTHRQPPDES